MFTESKKRGYKKKFSIKRTCQLDGSKLELYRQFCHFSVSARRVQNLGHNMLAVCAESKI